MQGFSKALILFLIPVLLLLATAGCTGDGGYGGVPAPVVLPPCEYEKLDFYPDPKDPDAINKMTSFPFDQNSPATLPIDSYNLLVYEMMKGSDQHDVVAGDVTYRFTITLIRPELIASMIWAEVINHKLDYSIVRPKFEEWIVKRITENRIYFLLTINSSDQGTLPEAGKQAIHFPIGDMTLTTMSGLTTRSPQGDGIFAYDLDSYDNPIRYLFYFPAAVLAGDNVCTQLIDPGQDLTFTLGIKTVDINGEPIDVLSWNFELAHLLNIDREGSPLFFSSTTRVTENPYLNNPVLPICIMPAAAAKNNTTTPTQHAGDIYYWLSFSMCAWETIAGIP